MIQHHMQSCFAQRGGECDCADFDLDMYMHDVPTRSAEESAAVKEEARAAGIRASRAYYAMLDRSGNKEHAKLAARYGAHGVALECRDFDTRIPSFGTIGNGDESTAVTDHEHGTARKLYRCGSKYIGVSCVEFYNHAPQYIVPKLRPGAAFINRRPGASSGWAFCFAAENECADAVFVASKTIGKWDASMHCYVFRVKTEHGPRYYAKAVAGAREVLAATGECIDIDSPFCLSDGTTTQPQQIIVFVAAETCS
jgi:hypothetical protein